MNSPTLSRPLTGPAIAESQNDTSFGLQLGTGIETPLDDPNVGRGAFWLGFAWRWKMVFMEPQLSGVGDLDSHLVYLTLTYKYNNVSAFRVDRPPELKYR